MITAQYDIDARIMSITAAVGVCVNLMYISYPYSRSDKNPKKKQRQLLLQNGLSTTLWRRFPRSLAFWLASKQRQQQHGRVEQKSQNHRCHRGKRIPERGWTPLLRWRQRRGSPAFDPRWDRKTTLNGRQRHGQEHKCARRLHSRPGFARNFAHQLKPTNFRRFGSKRGSLVRWPPHSLEGIFQPTTLINLK